MVIDHINHNTLDDSPFNLREVTNSINGHNRSSLAINNTSGVNGVSWFAATGKWEVHFSINSKAIHGGHYCTIEEATKARRQLESLYINPLNSRS